MSRQRQIFVLLLFSAASLVIIYVGIQWISDYFRSPVDGRATADHIRLLVSLSFLALLTLYLLRVALAQMIRWAFTHRKPKLARFFERIAPRTEQENSRLNAWNLDCPLFSRCSLRG